MKKLLMLLVLVFAVSCSDDSPAQSGTKEFNNKILFLPGTLYRTYEYLGDYTLFGMKDYLFPTKLIGFEDLEIEGTKVKAAKYKCDEETYYCADFSTDANTIIYKFYNLNLEYLGTESIIYANGKIQSLFGFNRALGKRINPDSNTEMEYFYKMSIDGGYIVWFAQELFELPNVAPTIREVTNFSEIYIYEYETMSSSDIINHFSRY